MRVNAVDPGYTATGFNGGEGGSVEQAAEPIVRLATMTATVGTGTFLDRQGAAAW